MLIIKSTETHQNADLQRVLSDIQSLADHVSCYCEDMENATASSAVMRLPFPLLPDYAQQLDNLFHNDENIVRKLPQNLERNANKPILTN